MLSELGHLLINRKRGRFKMSSIFINPKTVNTVDRIVLVE